MKHFFFKQHLLMFCPVTLFTSFFAQKQNVIHPGEVWPDEDGNHIQAHCGGVVKIKNMYYCMVNNGLILIPNNYYLPFKK